ncbi:MAG: PQQ-binding-like beta-propeller repeat protein, partial [Planctomycetales bacterium]
SRVESLPTDEAVSVAKLAAGPWLKFSAPHEAVVRWKTERPSPTFLTHWPRQSGEHKETIIQDPALKTEHRALLAGLRHNRVYSYRIQIGDGDQRSATEDFECDAFFNYNLTGAGRNPEAAADPWDAAAERILNQTKADRGICVVLECEDGRLAAAIARGSRLRVIAFASDPKKVQVARRYLTQQGLHGARVSVRHVESLDTAPILDRFANLVVSERAPERGFSESLARDATRLLRPDGGIAWLESSKNVAGSLSAKELQQRIPGDSFETVLSNDDDKTWAMITRRPLTGAGEWSHLYGRPDNSAFGGETLQGAKGREDFREQWIGRPGPRYQADRNGRKPSPLSTAGRLFLQGLDRVVAVDAFNGSPLWSLEIPGLRRFNMPRDCSNWCADRKTVYAAMADKCWNIDAATGEVTRMHAVVSPADSQGKFNWGYVAQQRDQILGSAVKQGAAFTNFFGGAKAGWYDARDGEVTHKVCSDNLFALDKQTGKTNWTYSGGVILNSTITVSDDRIFFLECRHPDVKKSETRRIGSPELWKDQYLVALDPRTGKPVMESPIDTEDGTVVCYMAHGDGKIVLVASTNKKYHVYAFDPATGGQVWKSDFPWIGGGDHGKAMSRPAITRGKLFVRPSVFDLATGKLHAAKMPGGGCGTYACTSEALIFRAGAVTMWDPDSRRATSVPRLRPDCWLSTIPAGGMLLSPEGGGGCSCGSWLETSIGFMPKPNAVKIKSAKP